MAVSMLTACSGSEVSKVKDALKDAGIAHNSAMTAGANDAMSKLQKATNAIAAGQLDMTKTEDVDKIQAELLRWVISASMIRLLAPPRANTTSTSGLTVRMADRLLVAKPSIPI